MIDWNSDMDAAPKDGFYVLINWNGSKDRYGTIAGFRNNAWRTTPNGPALPPPDKWRRRPESFL